MDELKPCPFCGSEAELETRTTLTTHIKYKNYRVGCNKCVIYTDWLALNEGKASAIEAWNRRSESKQCALAEMCRLYAEQEG